MKTLRTLLIAVSVALFAFQLAGDDSFNCHNYAWETERRWLDDPSAYVAAAIECDPINATRIVYYEDEHPIHSGLYLGHGWVKSKWGSNAILIHPMWVSSYGWNVRYYR